MRVDLDVNPAFVAWKLSTGQEKELLFLNLTKRMQRFATAVCLQRLPDHADDVDGLVNGIVWRAIKNEAQFKERAAFATWYYRIILNECNRFLRNYKRRFEVTFEEETPTARKELDAKIDVLALLDSLEGKEHTLFRLVAEGEDWNSIGKALGISAKAANERWRRLKEKLRDAV